jgi:hypothetical protein
MKTLLVRVTELKEGDQKMKDLIELFNYCNNKIKQILGL